jgi:Rrf2 family protein
VKLSKRGEYALRALIDLGIAQELGRPLIQIGELAEKEKLPEKFLEQILVQLKGAGFVESRRGKRGGYSLARPMESISFGQVVRLIDGPLAPIACVSQTSYAPCTCPDEAHCGLRMLMLDVRNAIANVLDRYTLADTVQITLRRLERDKVTFHLNKASPVLETIPNGANVLEAICAPVAAPPLAPAIAKPLRRVPAIIPPRPKRKTGVE